MITVVTLFCLPIIVACSDSKRSIYAICDDNPQICGDIETKGWCKIERSAVIRFREQQIVSPDNQLSLYRGLKHWQSFSHCIEIAANIKRRTVTDRDSVKETTFLTSLNAIDRLEKDTYNSNLPQFLYYHWAAQGDDSKIDKLIELDQNSQLNSTELQLMMASYYGKLDSDKAIASQYKALTLLTAPDLATLDAGLFASLATNFYRKKQFELSYVWTQVAVKSGLKENSHTALARELSDRNVNIVHLDELADDTYDSINALAFSAPNHKI